jgi:3-oxoacyl-[acyl-carrier protein] reductase
MGRIVVVGGGSGIGRAVALRFAHEGWRVTVLDADPAGVNMTVQAGEGIEGHSCDIRERAAVARAFAASAEKAAAIDALVVSAGVLKPALLADMSDRDYDLTFDVNTKGFLVCVQEALPYLAARGASIVGISSASGQRPKAGNGAYAASKAALQFLARTFAMELADRRVRVNCVAPGTIATPMTTRFNETPAESGYIPSGLPPLGRACTASDIADACYFLCSDQASFITGATLAVDGGLTAGVPLRLGR